MSSSDGRRTFALHHLTVMDVASVAELVSVAARCGYDAIDIFLRFRDGPWERPAMIETASDLAALRACLSDAGLRVHNLESFPLTLDFDFADFARKMEWGASLGASRATVFLVDTDAARRLDGFVRAAEIAAAFGIELGLEAAPISQIRPTAALARFIQASGVPNARCVVDLLHTHRSGETPAAIAAIDPRFIGSVQVNDAPWDLPDVPSGADSPTRRMHEAMRQRLFPGEGDLPIRAYFDALPPDLPISVETPHARAQAAGHGPAERAARALAGLRSVLEG